MYCKKCGYLNDSTSKYCASCGEYLESYDQNNLAKENKTNESSLIFGLLSIFFVTIPIVGLILAIIGLTFGIRNNKDSNHNGIIFSVIGLILNVISIIVIINFLLNISTFFKNTINNDDNNNYFYPHSDNSEFSINGNIFTINDEYTISFNNNTYVMYKEDNTTNLYELGTYTEYQGQESIDYINNYYFVYDIDTSSVWNKIKIDESEIDNYYLIILSPQNLTDENYNKYKIYFGLYNGSDEIDTKDLFNYDDYKFELVNGNIDTKSVV